MTVVKKNRQPATDHRIRGPYKQLKRRGVPPRLFRSQRPVNRLLGCGHSLRFDCRLAHNHHAINRRRPFPDAALDALNNGVFDVPILHHEPRFRGKRLTRRMGSLGQGLQKCRRNDREKSRLNNRAVDLQPAACTALAALSKVLGRGSCPFSGLAQSKRV
jgi:hypothetical protein